MAENKGELVNQEAYDAAVGELGEVFSKPAATPSLEHKEEESAVEKEADQIPEEAQETQKGESAAEEERKLSGNEQKAMEQGWKPKDKFDGDPDDWVSAREFNKNGEFIDVIKNQGKQIKKSREAIQMLVDQNKKLHESTMKEKAAELILAKREAIQNGNVEEVEQLDKTIDEIKKEVAPSRAEVTPEAHEFQLRNHEWFNTKTVENKAMYNYAIEKDVELHSSYPGWSDEDRYAQVEKATKKFFKIGDSSQSTPTVNANRSKAAAVNITPAENASLGTGKKKFTFNMLPNHMKQTVRTIADTCDMTLDEYANQLHELGDV